MDWIVTTGPSVADAVETALDELSVSREDVEFEVVAEPKTSIFGLRRKQAQVRVRVRPVAPPPKQDRRRPERNSKNRKPRNSGRKDKPKTGGSSRKRTAPNPGKTKGSNDSRTSERRAPSTDTDRDEKKDAQPASAGNRRKRTITSAQKPPEAKSSNIRSTENPNGDQALTEVPTIRRTRKIDY